MASCRETDILRKTKSEIKVDSKDLIIFDVKIVSPLIRGGKSISHHFAAWIRNRRLSLR